MTHEDINLIQSRSVGLADVPDSAIRLYTENIQVDRYNTEKINKFPGDEYISIAQDSILGKISEKQKGKFLDTLKKKKTAQCGGLMFNQKQ